MPLTPAETLSKVLKGFCPPLLSPEMYEDYDEETGGSEQFQRDLMTGRVARLKAERSAFRRRCRFALTRMVEKDLPTPRSDAPLWSLVPQDIDMPGVKRVLAAVGICFVT